MPAAILRSPLHRILSSTMLLIEFVGRRSNRQGIGARVTLVTDAGRQVREARAGESYLSSSDPRIHFGFGSAKPRRIEIRWPSGIVQTIEAPAAGIYTRVEEPER